MTESEAIASSPRKLWSNTRNGRIVVAAGMVGLFAVVFWLAMKSRGIVSEPAAFLIDEKHLWFGEVWEDPAFIWTIPITNPQSQDIEIKRFDKSCACVQIEPKSLMIPAGQTREVRLSLNLVAESTNETGLPIRDFGVGIAAETLSGKSSSRFIQWTIRGRVKKALMLSEPLVLFPHPQVHGEPFGSQKIVATPQIPILRLEARCQPDVASVRIAKIGSENDERWEVNVSPLSEKLPVGPFSFDVLLDPISQTEGRLPAVHLPVKGRVVDDIQADLSDVLLGERSIGEKGEGVVTLRSSKGQHFHIERIELPSGTSAQEIKPQLPTRRTFQIVKLISKQGDDRALVRFIVKTASGETIVVPVGVASYGVKVVNRAAHR